MEVQQHLFLGNLTGQLGLRTALLGHLSRKEEKSNKMRDTQPLNITVGVLALQGAFSEHIQHLRKASTSSPSLPGNPNFTVIEVRTPEQLSACDALILPGGESTTISLIAERSGLLAPLREFVRVARRPTWGTCAGMILLSDRANRTKRGGQEILGGLGVCVNRNHFGRQVESFECLLDMSFLGDGEEGKVVPGFKGVFIRAPVVEKVLDREHGDETPLSEQRGGDDTESVLAPVLPNAPMGSQRGPVEILASLPPKLRPEETHPENRTTANPATALGLDRFGRPMTPGIFGDGFGKEKGRDVHREMERKEMDVSVGGGAGRAKKKVPRGNVVAVRQGNVLGTSFHPELTGDVRMHKWWLGEVVKAVTEERRKAAGAV